VARNPKDVIVSYYHFHKLMAIQQFTGDFDTFVELFIKDESMMLIHLIQKYIDLINLIWQIVLVTPLFHHLLSAWKNRDHPNMHFMFYEDLKMVSILNILFYELEKY